MLDDISIDKNSLLIFDMDGTLFDTSESNYCAYRDAAAQFGYQIERDMFMREFVGRNYKEFLPLFGIDRTEELREIHRIKKQCYKKYLKQIIKNEELFELIENFKSEKIVALATTASKTNTLDILRTFGLNDLFDIILTQEDVKELKPNPECYLKIMQMAEVSAEQTVIFEDSDVGIMAATASGARCIKVNNFNKGKNNKYLCY